MIVAFVQANAQEDIEFATQILHSLNIDAKVLSYPSYSYLKYFNKPEVDKIILFGITDKLQHSKLVLLPRLDQLTKSIANKETRQQAKATLDKLADELKQQEQNKQVLVEEIKADNKKNNSIIELSVQGIDVPIGINNSEFFVSEEDLKILDKLNKIIKIDKITLKRK